MFATALKRAPGLCAAAATAAGGAAVASQLPSELHISGIPVSIVLGACAGNAAPAALKEALKPGVAFATSTVLRSGIVAVGAKHGLVHAGFHAMNSLRLEAGMRHWGHDITDEDTPIEAGLGFAIDWDKGEFLGRDALLAQKEAPRSKRLIQFRIEDPDLLTYHDEPIYRDGVVVGCTSSSMWSATQDRCCAMGYVEHPDGESITAAWLDDATWEVNIGGQMAPLSTSIRSWHDPQNQRPHLDV